MTIAREGLPFIFGTLVPGAILAGLYSVHGMTVLFVLGIVLVVLGIFCTAFFRNPIRDIPGDDSVLVSPADGKVVVVKEVDDEFVGPSLKVDIFLSVFDVHLNRIPTAGNIDFVDYRPGKFLSAFKDKASEDNERTDIGIVGARGKFRVAQIAGLIARRIVCKVNKNEAVAKGQLYGLIRFGSRTEITFPRTFEPCVKVGDRVRGGASIIAKSRE
ncbi:MAG: phosphatidylserine decarboxylase family protein [Candidatus Zixiibacteriota bacterium]